MSLDRRLYPVYFRKKVHMKKIIVGITGASGSIYAYRLIQILLENQHEVHLVMSDQAQKVMPFELQKSLETLLEDIKHPNLHQYDNDNLFSAIASGSYPIDGMVVVPCSMGTASKIALGISESLLVRAADVCFKEKRPLVIVPRETPLSSIHLRNLLSLSEDGAVILPPVPAFYNHPASVEDIVDITVGRLLETLKIHTPHHKIWGQV